MLIETIQTWRVGGGGGAGGCGLLCVKDRSATIRIPLLFGRQARISTRPYALFVRCRGQPTMVDNRKIIIW